MTTFDELRQSRGLRPYLASSAGTLYFDPAQTGLGSTLVRHFDRDIDADLTSSYAAIIDAAADWVDSAVDLQFLIRIERPTGQGEDYIERPYRVYLVSTNDYVDEDEPVEPPAEYALLPSGLQAALDSDARRPITPRRAVIRRIVARTILEPNERTYFDERTRQFVVVEPKIAIEDVRAWAATNAAPD